MFHQYFVGLVCSEMFPAAAPDAGGPPSLASPSVSRSNPQVLELTNINLFVECGLRNQTVFETINCNSYSYIDVWGWTSAESEWCLALILADVVSFNQVAPMCFKRTTPSLTKTFHLSFVLLPSSSSCSSSTTSLFSPWQRLYLSAPMWCRLLLKSRLFLRLNSSRHIYRKVPRQGKYSQSASGGLTDEERTELNTDLERFGEIVSFHKNTGKVRELIREVKGKRAEGSFKWKTANVDSVWSLFQFTVTFLVEGVYHQLVIGEGQAPPNGHRCKDNLELLIITCKTPSCRKHLWIICCNQKDWGGVCAPTMHRGHQ